MKYKCEKCKAETSQLYGSVINNKYTEICKKCMFHKV